MTDSSRLYDLLKETFLLLDFGDRRFLEQYGLTVSRYYTLHHIASNPGLSPSRLSRLMFCDKSNITRLLHGLESDGFVERRRDERDARAQCLYLTGAGARIEAEVAASHLAYVEHRLAGLTQPSAGQLVQTLTHLNQSLNRSLTGNPGG